MEEFITDFIEGEIVPIEIVSEITGLTYEEIRSVSKSITIDTNERYFNLDLF